MGQACLIGRIFIDWPYGLMVHGYNWKLLMIHIGEMGRLSIRSPLMVFIDRTHIDGVV